MAEHKCGTCKHYEAAPMWKKGWCRNPLLYSPQQSHLVGEDDLDCNRGMGSYWEPIESDVLAEEPLTRFTPPPARTIAPASATPPVTARPARASATRQPTAVRPRSQRAAPLVSESPDSYAVPPDDRSWSDYLRRGYPAIGVILLLGMLWLWSSAYLARRVAPPTTTPVATVPANLGQVAVIVPSPTAGAAPAPANPVPPPTPPPGVIAPGATVVVKTAADGARIRQQPSLSAPTVTAVANGTLLTITGPSQDADGYTWWPVQGNGVSGWVAGALIERAP